MLEMVLSRNFVDDLLLLFPLLKTFAIASMRTFVRPTRYGQRFLGPSVLGWKLLSVFCFRAMSWKFVSTLRSVTDCD